ncbi:MAG: hypothetical protein HQK72_08340 [Desulfamplus sp.]|nr:hypothetical protein [Desulfamplus sp.]
MTNFKQLYLASVVCILLCIVCITDGYCVENSPQTLIMGAQKDFLAVAEGKLLVFDSLVTLDDSGNIKPGLAESWNFSTDGKILTLVLRSGVIYHDGTPFDAKSAKFGLERAKIGAYWSKYIDDINIVSDRTVQVLFNTYYNTFLLNMTGAWQADSFISPSAVNPAWNPEGKIIKYIGTGAFKLADYKKEREALLIRNENYWGIKPKLSKVVWKYTPDPYAQIMALKAGELDIIGLPEHHSSVPFMKLGEFAANPDMLVSIQSYGRYQVLEFNCHKPPFEDIRIRKAFNYAIDRETMVRSLFGNITDPSCLITDPKFIWGPSNIKKGYQHDVEKANQLLLEAGWLEKDENGILHKNGKPFEIELLVTTGEANGDMIALVVQSQLKKIGINLKIKTLTNGWDKRLTGEYDLFLHHSGCLPSIPGGIGIGDKYHSKGWPHAYHSKELDQLIESAFTTIDESIMRQKCDSIWELLHQANPCIPLYDIKKAVVMNKKVRGFKHGVTMFHINLTDTVIAND